MRCDFLVAGAGMAGICAAIQGGRSGLKTLLVEKEMFLGGNSGTNLGVPAAGALHGNPYWNETGVVEEIEARVCWRSARICSERIMLNVSPEWDAVVSEMLREAGVTVLRKHIVLDVEVRDGRVVRAMLLNVENLDELIVDVDGFVMDSTGDANVAARAGADIAMGRESRAQTGERSAREAPDDVVSASSVVAMTVDVGVDCPFTPPPGTPRWNPEKPACTFISSRRINMLFQVDEGGESRENHPLYSPQDLHQRLVTRIYSIWDHFKNTLFPEEARTHQLVWISPILGRRESRRIVGDYMLTQTDIESCRQFEDAIGFGGFQLDEHPPSPDGGYETRFFSQPLPYDVPFRCIYSRNIGNLFSGGRCISATHLAFTSTRVIRTGGLLGQAAAVAAALCMKKGLVPRELGQLHTGELQQEIARQDGWIIGVAASDAADLAKNASVRASSEALLSARAGEGSWTPCDDGLGVSIYHYPKKVEKIAFYVRNRQSLSREVRLSLGYGEAPGVFLHEVEDRGDRPYVYSHPQRQNHVSEFDVVQSTAVDVAGGYEGWVEMDVEADHAFPAFRRDATAQAVLASISGSVEVLTAPHGVDVLEAMECRDGQWLPWESDGVPCFAVSPDPAPGRAQNVIDGHIHRFGRAHLHQWMSEPGESMPQWVELEFEHPMSFDNILLRYDVTERTWPGMYQFSGKRASDRLVADYRIDIETDGGWKPLLSERDNRLRFRNHMLPEPVSARRVRLVVERVWGDNQPARVCAFELYRR